MSGAAGGGGIRGSRDNDPCVGAEQAERKTEEQAARFAQALLPYFTPQPPPATPPEGWRPSDGGLTRQRAAGEAAGRAAGLAAPALDDAGAGDDGRVVVSVKTAELGELSLVLDRSADGVRVVIGVGENDKIAQMASERAALARQLAHSGVNVESIQVVPRGDIGIVLAQRRLVDKLRASGAADKDEVDKQRRRGSRKLDFTG